VGYKPKLSRKIWAGSRQFASCVSPAADYAIDDARLTLVVISRRDRWPLPQASLRRPSSALVYSQDRQEGESMGILQVIGWWRILPLLIVLTACAPTGSLDLTPQPSMDRPIAIVISPESSQAIVHVLAASVRLQMPMN
jgi:hypothetical protein